jgi:tetratricopeptide (TPR) repeat protein
MASDEEFKYEESGENTMLHEAMDALQLGDRARARDLLTRLLKTDEKNPTYWVWLSAAMDTQKERLYCLQMALQADPQNTAAKRGMIILGGLPADDSVSPFPINHPRLWEEKLKAPLESKERIRGWANPVVRLIIIIAIGGLVVGAFIGGSVLFSNRAEQTRLNTPTHRPSSTQTFTPSNTPSFRSPTPTFHGPTPLWMFLESTYTPTALYVITQHPSLTRASFEAGLRSLSFGDYNTARVQFLDMLRSEPDAADVYYYIGESYRMQADYENAKDAYQEAINRNPAFAPGFLGRARANLGLRLNVDIAKDLNEAIRLDPNYSEAYIVRGAFLLASNPSAAKADLEAALTINPNSAMGYLYLAEVQLNLGENEDAVVSATRAKELDMTLVPVYLTLARAYIATGQAAQSLSVLKTYMVYMPEDINASLQLGTAYNAAGEYEAAVEILNRAIDASGHNPEAYFQRGSAYLNLGIPNLAVSDFKTAITYDPVDFDSQLGLARAYNLQGKPGDAYIQAEQNALPLAKADNTKAQCYYWEAIFLENIPNKESARAYWNRLIHLPENAMPHEMRETAFEYLEITPTFIPTMSPTKTLVLMSTPSPTRTAVTTPTPRSTIPTKTTLASTTTLTKTP